MRPGIAYLVSACRLAHPAHDAGVRPVGPGAAAAHPQFRPARAAAGSGRARCRPSCTARSPPGEGQPGLSRLRHHKDGILQIVDRAKLLRGARADWPETCSRRRSGINLSSMNGAHTTLPVPRHRDGGVRERQGGNRRDFVVVVNESLVNGASSRGRCVHRRRHRREAAVGVSTFNVPEASGISAAAAGASARTPPTRNHRRCTPGAPCSWPGSMPAYARSTSAIRTIRARSAITSRPPTDRTDKRLRQGGRRHERCKVAIQTNNLDVDDRGYIYIATAPYTGMHILELSPR